MRVLREAYTEEDIRQRVADTRNIFEALLDSCYILASCFEDTEGDKETNDKLSRYAAGYAREVKDLAADFEDDYEDFIKEKNVESDGEPKEEPTEEETAEEEEVVEENLKETPIKESRTVQEMRDDIDDLIDELDAVEGERNECYITWNFGEDPDGNLTGGVDIHLHPRYENDPEKIEELKAKVETIFRNHGFELDSAFKVNPGKTLFGAIHYQIKKSKDDFDGFFSNSDVVEGLEDTLRTVDFGEIKIVPNDKITKFDKFIKNDSVDEWSYYQTANGDVVATKNESLNKNLKEEDIHESATMGSVEDFLKKMEGKSKAEAEKIVRQAKGNPNADEAYRQYLGLTEDTEKVKDGKWVNKGEEGTHGTFKTKKAADAQRKAMFANGYKESLSEDFQPGDAVDVWADMDSKWLPGYEIVRKATPNDFRKYHLEHLEDWGGNKYVIVDKKSNLFSNNTTIELEKNLRKSGATNEFKEGLNESWMGNLKQRSGIDHYSCYQCRGKNENSKRRQ